MEDFLTEASDLLSDVDSKLMGLEKTPHDRDLLNVIFRGFHTIKGGAGFLNATELVTLCHLTENLFDKLRNGELTLNAELMDTIFAATGEVRQMFGYLSQNRQPEAAPPHLIAALHAALEGKPVAAQQTADRRPDSHKFAATQILSAQRSPGRTGMGCISCGRRRASPGSACCGIGANRSCACPAPAAPVPDRRVADAPAAKPSPGRRESEGGGGQGQHHPGGYRPAGSGAQSFRRNRADQEPPDPFAHRHPARPLGRGHLARAGRIGQPARHAGGEFAERRDENAHAAHRPPVQ